MTAPTIMRRVWAMPCPDTLSIKPIRQWAQALLRGCEAVVDPFARNCRLAHWRNDLSLDTSAEYHMDAEEFLVSRLTQLFSTRLIRHVKSPNVIRVSESQSRPRTRKAARYIAECETRHMTFFDPVELFFLSAGIRPAWVWAGGMKCLTCLSCATGGRTMTQFA
jgi:hypothetical protein